eukprot:CAMPEP_0201556412 /NCGR_PEP_ID=MMETSP0173_2-20130828/55250_1 /ASSEMBLY_ACC=CAM_ASM_000268 /TAXON_ID=218659 /ORGANISM="Vexillifera sp., Strain DIVA3 564/2" /LENGTH=669 /DNA_ID=CAMNT_0047968679 /DNA_START=162 /DNA_END=2167 /DNA_ORIENTATION=+
MAVSIRLFSVLKWESVIHEFDPYFNYRTTRLLVKDGFYDFLNWFDSRSWYPLGRVVGGTLYPGLMTTAGFIYWLLHKLHFTVDIRNVCVFIGPLFSGLTALITYLFTSEAHDTRSGLLAAIFVAVVPGYIARSAAGSYDNEAVAITAMMCVFWLWLKACRTGSAIWSMACAITFFYMVAAWGGYAFIINVIPLHMLLVLVKIRITSTLSSHQRWTNFDRVYRVYCTFYVTGTLLAMQVPFIGFQPLRSSEHLASHGIFGLMQLIFIFKWFKQVFGSRYQHQFSKFKRYGALALFAIIALGFFVVQQYRAPMLGRFYSLFDLHYAKIHIPIIASVSEHQPNTWGSLLMDTHVLMVLVPIGLYVCIHRLSECTLFIILYAISSLYFSSIMVRLVLVLAPITCVLAGIGISYVLASFSRSNRASSVGWDMRILMSLFVLFLLALYSGHAVWTASWAYSSPSIVLEGSDGRGGKQTWDDFREAYYWLRKNTRDDAKIMSWWDYGYQLGQMADRTTLVDNNTWNNTHIATVGRAWASSERKAYRILKRLDVDYVMVLFGGFAGYSGDDIAKFLWMVRIAGGVFPEIQEKKFYSPQGYYTPGVGAPKTMTNSLMYRLSYYNFHKVYTPGQPSGYDRVRRTEIALKEFDLRYFQEVYTSERWLVRIYKLVDEPPIR